ncbi:BON domain-containing protein [Methylobacter sp.]|uniref:BON domain-containing protein n=1 Tax=Methylobacter sp. TaxID=2051955 RepID=UPI003DA52F6F
MMNQFSLIIRFLSVVLLVLSLAGCAGSRRHESTGEYLDDTVLTSKVKTAIFNDPSLEVLDINVKTFKGVVQLSGFVDSEKAANKAVERARAVSGVKMVNNSLIVK